MIFRNQFVDGEDKYVFVTNSNTFI